ncbi:DUF2946 domain-containing protein [Massilia sp. BJB1822]|uniref:DUF2946 domain-containing protein n=1 Tax=Massilia sp. BJB1822 TaxID=2744470 RepID=UPI001592C111|nr:DUF2946 domain-containing protein [Massilia sp. BJB1822]NVE00555.1 DUF2946 domain-containing protein [Massilia sp. BJB1822]
MWRRALWLSCFAILLNALAPSISHALSLCKGKQRSWEICLNDGRRLSGNGELDYATFQALTDRSKPQKQTPVQTEKMAMEDCGYCLTHAASFAPPPAERPMLAELDGNRLLPFMLYRAPVPLQGWRASIPRGPPAIV